MSQMQVTLSSAALSRKSKEQGHLFRVRLAWLVAIAFLGYLAVTGYDYYLLPREMRPFSDKHEFLRPSGSVGIKLGILGVALFCIIFLYALRKVIPWLGRIGTAKHWMDFHIVAGVSAPVVIAFHAAFKFNGIAGVAFWIMLAVALSGIGGRYLYTQIPRSLNAAELSYKELEEGEDELAEALRHQSIYKPEYLERIFAMPSSEHVRKSLAVVAIFEMMMLDIRRPFQIAKLRRKASSFGTNLRTLGGLFSSGNPDVENVIRLVRQKAGLSKRILFLDRTQRVFHLWHVIHRPFSYAFAVLAIIHIIVVMNLGFL